MGKYDKFFLDKCPCSKTSTLVCELRTCQGKTCQGRYLLVQIACQVHLSRKTCHIFPLHHQGKLVKENLLVQMRLKQIVHFTVVCLVTRPINEGEAGVDLVLIKTSLLFLCKFLLINMTTISLT